ncbi:MAG: AEC family transporter [Eubacteriaceae bacterium]
MNLINAFNSILTLFIIGIVGYFCRKSDILNERTIDNLPKFLLQVTLPCMIISSMQLEYSPEKINDIKTLLTISISAYVFSFILSLIISKIIKAKDRRDKGVYQFMVIFSNVAFIGYPVLMSIYSKEAIFYAAIYNLPFNFLVFTLGIFIMQENEKKIKINYFINPGLISVIIGITFYVLSIKIPELILQPLTIIGDLTTPLSMIFIGASLTHIDIKSILLEWRLYIISIVRLIIIPLLLLLVLINIIDNPLIIGIPVIISGMPVAANCAIISKQYGGNSDLASEGIFLTTLLSIITIPFIVFILSNIK